MPMRVRENPGVCESRGLVVVRAARQRGSFLANEGCPTNSERMAARDTNQGRAYCSPIRPHTSLSAQRSIASSAALSFLAPLAIVDGVVRSAAAHDHRLLLSLCLEAHHRRGEPRVDIHRHGAAVHRRHAMHRRHSRARRLRRHHIRFPHTPHPHPIPTNTAITA